MEKKIKELTLSEMQKMCDNAPYCEACPLNVSSGICWKAILEDLPLGINTIEEAVEHFVEIENNEALEYKEV